MEQTQREADWLIKTQLIFLFLAVPSQFNLKIRVVSLNQKKSHIFPLNTSI